MQEPGATAGIDLPQLERLALEDKQRARTFAAGDGSAHGIDARLDVTNGSCRVSLASGRLAELPHGRRHTGEAGVPVAEHLDAGAGELPFEFGLRAVGDDQVGIERQDTLGIGVEQRADPRQVERLGRPLVVAADGHHLGTGPDDEQHLGERRHQRDDALRSGLGHSWASRERKQDEERDGDD